MLHVCRLLSQWWCGVSERTPAADLPFRTRSTSIVPVEGHWRGEGDILWRPDLEPVFPFALECKNQEKGAMDAILEAPAWPVWSWWDQTCTQAETAAAVPLLLFTRNRRKDYVMLPSSKARRLRELVPIHGPHLEVTRPGGVQVTICLFGDLANVTPHRAALLAEDVE